jgi:alpha-mannosidase
VDVALAANGAQTAPASIDPESSGAAVYVLVNEFMRVTISQEANWGIEHLVHAETEDQVLAGPGNDLVFYGDGGGLYRFGNENGNSFSADTGVTVKPLGAEVLEAGPLRVRLRTEVTATPPNGGTPINFTREYALVAGEPFLRMSTTGAAFPADYDPPGYSVMTRFPLASPVARISHGTGCHWTDVQPRGVDDGYWGPPVFRATHDFLVPEDASGDALAAVYHGGMPAWAFDENGALIGCLLRNTPQSSYGAGGSDTAQHTQLYALRVPAGLAPPETGRPLQEARRFNTPLRVAAVPAGAGGSASSGSLAAVSEPAIITVAKPGSFDPASLILRLYQPSNRTATVQVTLGSPPSAARVVNALEGEWHGPATPLTPDEFGFSLKMPAALATVQVDGPA